MTEEPRYKALTVYGPFKRLEAEGTQTPSDMRAIVASGELWGGPPASRPKPAAQAYNGPLLPGERGFEFFASTPPDAKWGPPHWRERPDGSVWVEEDVAKVRIFVSRVTMDIG